MADPCNSLLVYVISFGWPRRVVVDFRAFPPSRWREHIFVVPRIDPPLPPLAPPNKRIPALHNCSRCTDSSGEADT